MVGDSGPGNLQALCLGGTHLGPAHNGTGACLGTHLSEHAQCAAISVPCKV